MIEYTLSSEISVRLYDNGCLSFVHQAMPSELKFAGVESSNLIDFIHNIPSNYHLIPRAAQKQVFADLKEKLKV